MSGIQGQFPPGLGVVDEDLQRVADVAAQGEDRALSLLAAPGGADGSTRIKRIWPLHDELRAPMAISGTSDPRFNNPRVLVAEAGYFGDPVGRVRVLPFAVEVYPASTAPASQQTPTVGRYESGPNMGPFSSTAGGRVDTVYATVAWTVPSGGQRARRIKNPTSGVVATQTANVYRELVVTIHVAVGTEASSTPGAVPADGAESYNVKLAEVSLPAGYTSGGALLDGSGGFIRQKWARAGVRPSAMRHVRPGQGMTFTNADAGLTPEVPNSDRGSELHIVRPTFRHTAAAAVIVLDTGLDWRGRLVRVTIMRSASQSVVSPYGNYPPLGEGIFRGGQSNREETGWVNTGLSSDPTVDGTAFWENSGTNVRLFANSATGMGALPLGALVLEMDDAPTDGANGGDHYVVIAEALARDVEQR